MEIRSVSNALDRHGDSWRRWVLENIERGCTTQDILRSMLAAGVWQEEEALSALNEGLGLLGRTLVNSSALPRIPADRLFSVGAQVIEVLSRFKSPHVAVLGGVLSINECDALLDMALHKGLRLSSVVDKESGQSVSHHERTSTGVFFTRSETPLIQRIEERLAEMTCWPPTHGEGLQVLRYEIGQQYKPHHDWFDTAHPGTVHHLARGGQRVATTVMVLRAADRGGATTFPAAGFEVSPPPGGAVFFRNLTAAFLPDPLTLHAGAPVEQGEKVVMTYWQREREFA
jgi:prolyl 4-hydroxylase